MTRTGALPPAGSKPSDVPLYSQRALPELAESALRLIGSQRAILGIVGEPGAGKSTFAGQLLAEVSALRPGVATAVSMDGFHLAQKVIDNRGQSATKGAIDTFDAHGFIAMLRRTHDETQHTLWWPEFRREIEEPVAGAAGITPQHRLVIVDGNFLLATAPPWDQVRSLLTETWFLDANPDARRDRLTRRYVQYGFSENSARAKVNGIDERTSATIRRTGYDADLILTEEGH